MSTYHLHRSLTISEAVHEAMSMATNVRDDIVRHVRSLIEIWRGVPVGSEAEERLYRDIRREMERLRGVDLAAADELELEILDPHSGDPSTWPAQWDHHVWVPAAEIGGLDLVAGVGADETDSNEGEDEDAPIHPEPPDPDDDWVDDRYGRVTWLEPDADEPFAPPGPEPEPQPQPTPQPDDEPERERLSLVEWVESIACHFAAFGTEAGDLVADALADLASMIRATGARTPAQARDRMTVLATPCPEFWSLVN